MDIGLICIKGVYNAIVSRKSIKLSMTWSSNIPKRYKRIVIIGDLHRSKRILTNFADEFKHTETKFLKADYPLQFVDGIIGNFQSRMDAEDSFVILPNFTIPPFHKWKISLNKLDFKESKTVFIIKRQERVPSLQDQLGN